MEDEVFRIKVAAAGACMPGVSEDSVWSVVGGAGDMSEMPNVVESPRTGSMVGSFRQLSAAFGSFRQLSAAVASALAASVM